MLIQRRPCESESKFFINFSIHSQAWAPGGSNDRMARGLWYQKIQANSQSLMRFNRVGSELFISLHTQLIVLGCALAFQSLFHLGSFSHEFLNIQRLPLRILSRSASCWKKN
nr:uncharacterized protein LOC112801415 isoform X3 [Arachis hypogaea]